MASKTQTCPRVHECPRNFRSLRSMRALTRMDSSKSCCTTSTFLPPFAPRSLRASQLLWRLCLPHAFHVARRGIPDFATRASDRSVPKHLMISRHRFLTFLSVPRFVSDRFPSAPFHVWTSPSDGRLVRSPGRNRFLSYGPVICLPMLSTPPLRDAVSVGFDQ